MTACVKGCADGERSLIVSMASYPPRIKTLMPCLESLLAQTVQPDAIMVWLYRSEFPGGESDLPENLRALVGDKVQIRWTDVNLKPHNKYFWTMRECPDAVVVTVDDDLLYRPSMIEDLLVYHRMFPRAVIAHRTHLMLCDDNGELVSYDDWLSEQDVIVGRPSMSLMATNGAGALFPPQIIPLHLLDEGAIQEKCLHADDLWLKVLELQANVPVVATGSANLTYVPDTQECGLWLTINSRGGNDVVLKRLAPCLEPYKSMLKAESPENFVAVARRYLVYRRDSRSLDGVKVSLEQEKGLSQSKDRALQALQNDNDELKRGAAQLFERLEKLEVSRKRVLESRERLKEKVSALKKRNRVLREENIRMKERLKDPYFVRMLGRIWRKLRRG